MLDNLQKVINWAFAQGNETNIIYNWSDMHQNLHDQDINLSIFLKLHCSYTCERGNGLLHLWRMCLWSGSWRQKMVRSISICEDVRRKHEDDEGNANALVMCVWARQELSTVRNLSCAVPRADKGVDNCCSLKGVWSLLKC